MHFVEKVGKDLRLHLTVCGDLIITVEMSYSVSLSWVRNEKLGAVAGSRPDQMADQCASKCLGLHYKNPDSNKFKVLLRPGL